MNTRWKNGFDAAKSALVYSDAPIFSKRMGAALFSGSNLVAIGFNRYNSTHPKAVCKGFNKSIHAEHRAVIKRQHYDNSFNMVMYVYRENHKLEPVCSKPCSNCCLIMKEAGIKSVRFIDTNGQFNEIKL